MPLLDEIAAGVYADVKRDIAEHPIDVTAATRRPHDLAAALRTPGVHVIAEVKRASPSSGDIAVAADVPATAESFVSAGAIAISILTQARHFKGSRETLIAARQRNPDAILLMKDFVVDPYQIDRALLDGADVVLLIVRLLGAQRLVELYEHARSLGLKCLVEVHNEEELAIAARAGAEIIGVNNRDLSDLTVSLETSRRLASQAPPGALLVSESGIESGADIAELGALGFCGFLVGTTLMRSPDPALALAQLLADAA